MNITAARKGLEGITTRLDAALSALAPPVTDIPLNKFQAFIESLKITTEEAGQQSLLLRPAQEQIWHAILEAWEAKDWDRVKPWFIILKSRREGVSTLITAILFCLTYFKGHKNALIAAHEWDATLYLFNMVRQFHDYLPVSGYKQKTTRTVTRQELLYAPPHSSAIRSRTANRENLVSGQLLHYVHFSEHAKWPSPEDPTLSVMQTIPNHWDTLLVWESTAYGTGNQFHRTWKAAKSQQNDFTPIFLSWRDFPSYHWMPADGGVFSTEERALQEEAQITDEQLAWVQWTLANKCDRSWPKFHQEYPWSDEVAFVASGMNWFDAGILTEHQKRFVKETIVRGDLEWGSPVDPYVILVPNKTSRFEVWEYPEETGVYVVGADISEGIGASYTVITVLRVHDDESLEMVAKYRSCHCKPENAGLIAFKIGCWYNRALMGVENNNLGYATLQVMEDGCPGHPQTEDGYGALYYHRHLDKKTQKATEKRGWSTTSITRPLLFNHMRFMAHDFRVIIRSNTTLYEMGGIIYDPDHRKWSKTAEDPITRIPVDDEVFALGVALQMAKHAIKLRDVGRPHHKRR